MPSTNAKRPCRFMLSKRRREDSENETNASRAVRDPGTYDTALAVVRRLVKKFSIDPFTITSNITYAQAAPLVGLVPWYNLTDIQTFELHRSRIPTGLFKCIVKDTDDMLTQFGSPPEHEGEAARSRFISPVRISDFLISCKAHYFLQQVLTHLVKLFNFTIRNKPETILQAQRGTQGSILHTFKIFGAIAILFIEVKFSVGNDEERMKFIAQVIAESNRKLHAFMVTPSEGLLNPQVVTSITAHRIFFYPSTAFYLTGYPLNSSCSNGLLILRFAVAAFLETPFTSAVACKYPTLRSQKLLFHLFCGFAM
jgi:hypothetical protein